MVNGKGRLVIISLLFIFSLVMAGSCFILVIHFVVQLASCEKKTREEADDDEQQVPWDRFGVAFFIIFATAFVFIAVFSGSTINSIVNNGTKVVPTPSASIEDEEQPPIIGQ